MGIRSLLGEAVTWSGPFLLESRLLQSPEPLLGQPLLGALGRTDGTLELWDLTAGRLSTAWSTVTNALTAVAFSPDGQTLAAGYLTYPGQRVQLYHAPRIEGLAGGTAAWSSLQAR